MSRLSHLLRFDRKSVPLYAYERLPGTCLRLLDLSSLGRIPLCSLVTYRWEQAPEYDALSYHWGGETLDQSIKCDGHVVKITQTLYDAIRTLYKYYPQPRRLVWIDAICLNQKDEVEKGTHVPLMSRVYTNAKRVMVWLGSSVGHHRALDQVPRILGILQTCGETVTADELRRLGVDTGGSLWHELCRIFQHTWFKRLWTFQEVVLAKHAIIVCGTGSLEWKVATAFAEEIERLHIQIQPNGEEQHFRDCVRQVRRTKENLFETPGGQNLAELLLISQTRQCSEPIDRIWSLMGLFPPDYRAHIMENQLVDYSTNGRRQYWKAYLGLAKYEILRDPYLRMLSMSSPESSLKELPSWCPDFSSLPESQFLWFEQLYLSAGWSDLTRDKEGGVRDVPNSNSILVPGFTVDRVRRAATRILALSSDYVSKIGPNGDASKALQWDKECFQMAQEPLGPNPANALLTFACLLSDNDLLRKRHTAAGDQEIIATYKAYLQLLRAFVRDDEVETNSLSNRAGMNSYAAGLCDRCEGRRFFTTEQGRIGVGNRRLLPGDHICVFYGGRELYLLRGGEKNTGYRFMGTAYVDGLMEGEAFNGRDATTFSETFLIH